MLLDDLQAIKRMYAQGFFFKKKKQSWKVFVCFYYEKAFYKLKVSHN